MDTVNLEIKVKDQVIKKSFKKGVALYEICDELKMPKSCDTVAAIVNNTVKELTHNIEKDAKVEFIGIEHIDGFRIYARSIVFLLLKVIKEFFPNGDVIVRNSGGLYCEFTGIGEVTQQKVDKIQERMKELVKKNIPFNKHILSIEEGKKYYKELGLTNKYNLIEDTQREYITLYELDGLKDYFYGYMVLHTGYLNKFQLKVYANGVIILCRESELNGQIPLFDVQKKLFDVFNEFKEWNNMLEIENVGSINKIISDGKNIGGLIMVAEALQEKKIANIADMICHGVDDKKIVLIAGPSSSGKTTFSKRLAIQLAVNKKRPTTISLDDYFLNREQTPLDEDGNLDYESIRALDIELFNQNLLDLINGKEVEIPTFNFKTGRREDKGKKLKLEKDSIIIIEGIHGLNDELTKLIDKKDKFRIYISALTTLNLDEHNGISTTDNRLLRRIVRDNQFRGISAKDTIDRWHLVRRGEEKNIFPFQNNADTIFNSALIYEIFVLKGYAEKLLKEIDDTNEEHIEAKRLLSFLSYFKEAPIKNIPQDSILKEFIGGSCFDY